MNVRSTPKERLMKSSEDRSFRQNAFFGKTSVILMILFINVCLMVPVWQSATNSQLRRRLAESERLIKETEESRMVVTASIASKMTPEYLVEQSTERNIVFKQIGGAQIGAMANAGANASR